MYLILAFLAFSILNTSADSNEEKFIDLLPEEEKLAFLEKVARRLVDGVRTKDSRYKSSEEVSDEELNRHSAYVKQVLEEESGNLRRKATRGEKQDSKELKVEGIGKQNVVPDVEDVNHIDLTLRHGHRRKRDGDDDYKKVPVETVYDVESNKVPRKNSKEIHNSTVAVDKEKELSGEKSTAEDIQVRVPNKTRKVNESPNINKNAISHEATKIADYDPDEVTGSYRTESGEYDNSYNETESLGSNKKGYTVPIYVDEHDPVSNNTTEESEIPEKRPTVFENSSESSIKSSNSDIANEPNTVSDPFSTTLSSSFTADVSSTTNYTVEVVTIIQEELTHTEKLNKTKHKKYLRSNNEEAENTNNDFPDKIKSESIVIDSKTKNEFNKNDASRDSNRNLDYSISQTISSQPVDTEALIETRSLKAESLTSLTENNDKEESNNSKQTTSLKMSEDIVPEKVPTLGQNINTIIREISKKGQDSFKLNNAPSQSIWSANNTESQTKDDRHVKKDKRSLEIKHNQLNSSSEEESNNDELQNKSNMKVNDTKESTHANVITEPNLKRSNSDSTKSLEDAKSNKTVENTHANVNTEPNIKENNFYSTTSPKNKNSNKIEEKSSVPNGINIINSSVDNNVAVKELNVLEKSYERKKDYSKNGLNTTSEKPTESFEKSLLRSDDNNQYVFTTTEGKFLLSPDPLSYKLYNFQNDSGTKENDKVQNLGISLLINNQNDLQDEKSDKIQDVNDSNSLLDKDSMVDFVSQSMNLKNILDELGQRLESKTGASAKKGTQDFTGKKSNEYLVYEVPEGETPFIKREKEINMNQDQPYYVPVYNYSPNNAYYNAYNRLGPNVDASPNDEDVKIVDEREKDYTRTQNFASDSYEDLRKFQFAGKKLNNVLKTQGKINTQFKLPLPIVLKKPKFTEVYFNPDDYLDLDYYFGRSRSEPDNENNIRKKLKRLPISSESGEVSQYQLFSEGAAKTHLHAVRQILFSKGRFGYVEPYTLPEENLNVSEVNQSPVNHDTVSIFRQRKPNFRSDQRVVMLYPNSLRQKENDESKTKEISIDYYFGVNSGTKQNRGLNKDLDNILADEIDPNMAEDAELIQRRQKLTLENLVQAKTPKNTINKNIVKLKSKGKKNDKEIRNKNETGTIKEILLMSDTKDVFKVLKDLEKLKIPYARRKRDVKEVNVYLNVLRDMIEMDNKALAQYDWLGSTVDVLSALDKLKKLTTALKNGKSIHPADLQLFKYVIYLYNTANTNLEDPSEGLRKKKNALPRNNKRRKEFIKFKMYIRGLSKEDEVDLNGFQKFLKALEESLFDIHDALKHISLVTKYKKQRWYQDLKEVYLKNTERRDLLEVLIHVFTAKLVGFIEYSALNGLKDGYLDYVEQNTQYVNRTLEEFVFVLKFLDAFNNRQESKL